MKIVLTAGVTVAAFFAMLIGTMLLIGACSVMAEAHAAERCAAAGRRDNVPVRYTASEKCTTRGVFGIRVPVDY